MKYSKQIKNKTRVSRYGEVFTQKREVNAMLNLVNDEVSNITSKVLEPACGEGAFIIEILNRRLNTIKIFGFQGILLEWKILQAVSNLYGVDILNDNILICKQNILNTINHFIEEINYNCSKNFYKALNIIVNKNILCGNSITYTNQKKDLIISEWKFNFDGTVTKFSYLFKDLVEFGDDAKPISNKYTFSWYKNNENNSLIKEGVLENV